MDNDALDAVKVIDILAEQIANQAKRQITPSDNIH
jgi:hypothetical protein